MQRKEAEKKEERKEIEKKVVFQRFRGKDDASFSGMDWNWEPKQRRKERERGK